MPGLLRRVSVGGDLTSFDTNVGNHHHFYIEGENLIIDVPEEAVGIGHLPEPPEGYVIARVDAIVRLRRIELRGQGSCEASRMKSIEALRQSLPEFVRDVPEPWHVAYPRRPA